MDGDEIRDVEESLQPEPRRTTERPVGFPWGAVLLMIWAVALIIFSVQNADVTTVQFLGWSFEMPVALLVMVTALITLIVAAVGSAFYRRRRRKRAIEKEAAKSDG
jgi:uncharacterized integral membrane protein